MWEGTASRRCTNYVAGGRLACVRAGQLHCSAGCRGLMGKNVHKIALFHLCGPKKKQKRRMSTAGERPSVVAIVTLQ